MRMIIVFSAAAVCVIEPAGADSFPPAASGECTIGVFSPDITNDGRPLLWKNRDVSNADQRYIYFGSYERDGIATFPFIGNVYRSDTTGVYMGINAAGFAIANANSYNLEDSLYNQGITYGGLMRIALETCETLEDFETLLDSTDAIGRESCWNLAVFDTDNKCAMYECANYSYVKFTPYDFDGQLGGYVIRANYSLSGGNVFEGRGRFKQAVTITENRLSEEPIDADFILKNLARDLRNVFDDPYPMPYEGSQEGGPPGYIFNFGITIANYYTSSAVVIRGAASGEDRSLATTFAVLGSPSISVAYPLWVKSGSVPMFLSHPEGAPMFNYCQEREGRLYDDDYFLFHLNTKTLVDDNGGGIYSYTFPLEDWGIAEADDLLELWLETPPQPTDVAIEQMRIANAIFTGFQLETAEYLPDRKSGVNYEIDDLVLSNYPNPFNSTTRITFEDANPGYPTTLRIFDTLGRLVREFDGTSSGDNMFVWEGRDNNGNDVSSGVYYYLLESGAKSRLEKMLYLK